MALIDPSIVAKDLEKPISLDAEMRPFFGLAPQGEEKQVHYSLRDKWRIAQETDRIYKQLTKNATKGGRQLTVTTGGPGSGKTTLIREFQKNGGPLANTVHVDSDEILKLFRPYNKLVDALGDTDTGRAIAYVYWRQASIYMMNTILNRLGQDGYDIAVGTTATSPAIKFLYDNARKDGYGINVIMCHANEETRLSGVAARFQQERRFTPEADVKEKGNRLFPAIVKTHFENADRLSLYWRDGQNVTLAAEASDGMVVTKNAAARDAFVAEIKARNRDFDWNDAVNAFAARRARPAAASPAMPVPAR